MLNPSIADEIQNDPTVERCERRARQMGYGGLEVVNLFALCSTEPRRLYTFHDPIGPGNDRYILDAARGASMVICAWGRHGLLNDRGPRVRCALWDAGIDLYALKGLRCGEPGHPLYVPYAQRPFPLNRASGA